MTTDTEYNGWTNWATWNVNLWIENDFGLYEARRDWCRQATDKIEAQDVEDFCNHVMGGRTPDMGRDDESPTEIARDIASINFAKIAEHWELDRQEMLTDA